MQREYMMMKRKRRLGVWKEKEHQVEGSTLERKRFLHLHLLLKKRDKEKMGEECNSWRDIAMEGTEGDQVIG